MSYLLVAIAGLWMADGLALLLVPLRMIALLKESLVSSPAIVSWSGLSLALGVILLIEGEELSYHPLWEQGYVSIGDWHTTQSLQEGMSEQDTRFFGLKRECGLHEFGDGI